MKRRTFVKSATLAGTGITAFGLYQAKGKAFSPNKLTVNSQRIQTRINELAKFGHDDNGHGYRVAYTQGDIEGRSWFMELMKNAGLNPAIDHGGNSIGKRAGKNPSLKPIAFGSHLDMVPDGGNYDGTLGCISALEVIEVLNENNTLTEHPLEVIVFANEEGGLIGSRAMVGPFPDNQYMVIIKNKYPYF